MEWNVKLQTAPMLASFQPKSERFTLNDEPQPETKQRPVRFEVVPEFGSPVREANKRLVFVCSDFYRIPPREHMGTPRVQGNRWADDVSSAGKLSSSGRAVVGLSTHIGKAVQARQHSLIPETSRRNPFCRNSGPRWAACCQQVKMQRP